MGFLCLGSAGALLQLEFIGGLEELDGTKVAYFLIELIFDCYASS